MKSYIEFCNEQTKKLFQIIDEHGGLLQWQRTWHVKGCFSLPKSANGYYRGVNLWCLLTQQIERGLRSDIWLTFNQIKQQVGHVLKGARGSQVCFFKLKEAETEEQGEMDNQKKVPLFRLYTVFNLDQTSLVDKEIIVPKAPEKLQKLLAILNVQVSEFGNQPCFKPSDDVIVMPRREFFNSDQEYDVTLLHELVHWVGHSTRLNRESAKHYSINDAARAEEELVAEIGSVFLAGYFGVSGDLVNHASYVASWKKLLDTRAVGRAMSHASKSFHWLVAQLEEQDREAAA